MSENTMPAAEAAAVADERELARYELAFHVLPTVAEGEVTNTVDAIKGHITKAGGEVFDEETPQRFDLAYEIVKHLESKNRAFTSAYFGWIRFTMDADIIEQVMAEVADEKALLRHLLIRLTKVEEENPFRFHEALETPMVRDIDSETESSDENSKDTSEAAEQSTDETEKETDPDEDKSDEKELDEASKKEDA